MKKSQNRTIAGRKALCLGLATASLVAGFSAAVRQASGDTIDHYSSTGDNLFIGTFLPFDSPAAINASFDLLKDVYDTRRIYWRGMQETLYIQTPDRVENVVIHKNIENSRDLIENQNLNQMAAQAAHARGMQFWGVSSIFDWGVAAKDPIFYGYTGDHEHWIRVNNPEWIPVDKFGYRRQGGPIEMAYEGARQAMVDWHVNEIMETGYDGMISHTYNENFTMRYWDEFGFNQPIVDEFKARYGVDIRKETFNRQDWYDLRGEYVTQFLDELHTELSARGKGLSMAINALDTDKPSYWLQLPFSVAGNITMDWQTWAQNGYVDELAIWGSSDIAFNEVKNGVQGTGVETSIVTSEVYFPPLAPIRNSGAPVVGAYNMDEEYLLRSNIPVQPLSALNTSPDVYKRMRVLSQIIAGSTTATVADVTPSVSHSNLIMRRLALKALGKIGDPAGVPTIESALLDPENSIRTAAVWALVDENRPESAQAILNAIDQYGNSPLMEGAVAALRTIPSAQSLLQTAVASHADPNVRAVSMRAIAMGSAAVPSSMVPTMINAMNDSEAYVRAFAVDGLARVVNSSAGVTALVNATNSTDPILSNRAASGLASLLRASDPNAISRKAEVVGALDTLFRKFGDGNTRGDADWGYRQVGQALYSVPPDGLVRLKALMNQRVDRKLSEQAWEILHLQQRPGEFVSVTEANDEYAHFKRPRWDTLTGASDSFNLKSNGSQIHNQKAQIGQTWQVTQGNLADQTVQTAINNGGNALKTIRRHNGTHELRLSGDSRDALSAEISLVTAKADWYRTSATDLAGFGLDIGAGIEAQITIDPNSNYRVWQSNGTANGGSYLQTNVPAGTGGWETIEIVITWAAASGTNLSGTYDVFLTRDASSSLGALPRTLIADNVAMHTVAERTMQQLFISNQPNGSTDVTTYWDNISLTVGRVAPSIVGDADLDGDVDLNDLAALATAYGTSQGAPWTKGNFDADMDVDLNDLAALAGNYGYNSGTSETFAEALAMYEGLFNVPEPATGALLLASFGLMLPRIRRN